MKRQPTLYAISVRGPLPLTLAERIAAAHAQALQARRPAVSSGGPGRGSL